jgi:hypothetical protein
MTDVGSLRVHYSVEWRRDPGPGQGKPRVREPGLRSQQRRLCRAHLRIAEYQATDLAGVYWSRDSLTLAEPLVLLDRQPPLFLPREQLDLALGDFGFGGPQRVLVVGGLDSQQHVSSLEPAPGGK